MRYNFGMSEERSLRAGAWQRSVADQWASDATADGSLRHNLLGELCLAVEELLAASVGDSGLATSVISELPNTLRRCDLLPFDTVPQCLAYATWHLADRYGRTQQALDALFAGGHLPLRREGVCLLEVGSGPAPAVYAAIDYYRHLAEWCYATGQSRQLVGLRRADTLDRGPAWGPLLHRVSELRLSEGNGVSIDRTPAALRGLPFTTTYPNLRSFSVRRSHDDDRRQTLRWLQAEADQADEYLPLSEAQELAWQPHAGLPSAYDLIVMCNFLTSTDFTATFTAELRELAQSLTPGGILLVLGAVGGSYPQVYSQLDHLVAGPGSPNLKPVIDARMQAHVDPVASRLVATQIVQTLSDLERANPAEFDTARQDISPDVHQLDVEQVKFPDFTVRAFKREGPAALSRREKRRQNRRRRNQTG